MKANEQLIYDIFKSHGKVNIIGYHIKRQK